MKHIFLIAIALFFNVNSVQAQKDSTKGKKLFNSNCAACHKLHKKLIGPALGNISERRKLSWTVEFIKDSKALMTKGDKDAIGVFNKYNKIPMISYSFLKEEEILNIIAYLNSAE